MEDPCRGSKYTTGRRRTQGAEGRVEVPHGAPTQPLDSIIIHTTKG